MVSLSVCFFPFIFLLVFPFHPHQFFLFLSECPMGPWGKLKSSFTSHLSFGHRIKTWDPSMNFSQSLGWWTLSLPDAAIPVSKEGEGDQGTLFHVSCMWFRYQVATSLTLPAQPWGQPDLSLICSNHRMNVLNKISARMSHYSLAFIWHTEEWWFTLPE